MRFLILLSFLTITFIGQAQSKKSSKDSSRYDYLSHDYKYLDKDFQIHIESAKFDSIGEKYRFHPKRMRSWKDSLSVVLMGEFGSWKELRGSQSIITFSNLRSSYYLWITPEEVEEMSVKRGFSHPYRFYEYYRYYEEMWDRDMKKFMKKLRKKVAKASDKKNVKRMTNKMFLREALILSPQRVIDFKKKVNKRLNHYHNRKK